MKLRTLLAAAIALALPALAAAQRMPAEGGWSVWAGLGLTNPAGDDIDAAVGASTGLDYFVTRNFSLGAMGGIWKADTDFGLGDDEAREAYVTFVGTYNWEGGNVHPFIQGGAGAYFVDFPLSDRETKLGGFAGGGLDIFFSKSTAIDIGLRYHFVPDVRGIDSKFFEAHGGVKFYF